MLQIISPAKTLNFSPIQSIIEITKPNFNNQAEELVGILKTYSLQKIQTLLEVSDKLAILNYERYQTWLFCSDDDKKQAIYAYNGDVYEGIAIQTISEKGLQKVQQNLRILSGLYGVLKPLDGILPHRLEMGTILKTKKGKNLYEYWGDKITKQINEDIKEGKHEYLINLASNEYFKALHIKKITVPIINCQFKDYKNGKLQMISFYAKKARGLMVRYIAENDVTEPEHLIGFDYEGYCYDKNLSNESNYVFTR